MKSASISEVMDLLSRRDASSEEVTRECLRRVEAGGRRLNAFVHVDPEYALAQARAADAERGSGGGSGERPLLGVPIALKDNLADCGQPLTCASRILAGFRPPYDATAVARLKQAGAVVLGRLNMDEFAMGSSSENSAMGPTRNPWDPNLIPGGSSGGAAAAVAARICPGAIASDTGGSIRQPAALCGCVGLKPSYGRVSRYGLVAFASSLDQIGAVTTTVSDAARLLQVVAGHDSRDSTSVPREVPNYLGALDNGLNGRRIGVPREYFVGGVDPRVRDAVQAAIHQLEKLGAEIREISLPYTDYATATYYIVATAEASANLARYDGIRYGLRVEGEDPVALYSRTRGQGFGAEVKRRIVLGTYVLSSGYYEAYYLRAQKVRALIARDFARAFDEVDAIAAPVSPTPAFPIGEKVDDPLRMYLCDIFTLSANLAGICGVSVPCGFTEDPRLPIGMQVLGPPFAEGTILQIAHHYEQATAWHRECPPV